MDRPRARKPAIPLTLVTGPAGAGKTTLINRLLAGEAYRNTAVILNEFGRTALAETPAEAVDDSIIALGSGCICCSVRGELVAALERLLRGLDNNRIDRIDRVVIEADGAADPAAVLAGVVRHPYLQLRYRPAGIVALLPANSTTGMDGVTVRQVAMADGVVLSGEGDGRDEANALLGRINPWARRAGLDGDLPDLQQFPFWSGELMDAADGRVRAPVGEVPPAGPEAVTVRRDRAFRPAALQGFTDHAAHVFGPALVRVLGVSEADDARSVVRGLDGMFLPVSTTENAGVAAARTTFQATLHGVSAASFADCIDGFLGEVRVDTPDGAALSDNPLAVAGFSARPVRR